MRKFNNQYVLQVTRDLANPQDTLTSKILSMTLISFTHNIYTLISHKIKEGGYLKEKP